MSNTQSNTDNRAFFTECLNTLLDRQDLPFARMQTLMQLIMQGQCDDITMAALLAALRTKGESVDEITAAARVMIDLADTVDLDVSAVDIVGTGGDGANLFNVSTAAAFVVASLGVPVAKHGNKGVSSASGASDVLTALGVNLSLDKDKIIQGIHQHHIGFLFAPNHHKAIKHAIPVRQTLKVRTIFNLLGPLANPAGVRHSVIGVYDRALCPVFAAVLKNLGTKRALVVASEDGLDELSIANTTYISELNDGTITHYTVHPNQLGLQARDLSGLCVQNSQESLAIIQNALSGMSDDPIIQKAQDIIALNAGAALYVAGKTSTLHDGVTLAKQAITQGSAFAKLGEFAAFTQNTTA